MGEERIEGIYAILSDLLREMRASKANGDNELIF